MNKIKLWILAALLLVSGVVGFTLTSCSSDNDAEEVKLPEGQWLYEGKGFLNDNYDAALIDIRSQTYINLLGRSVADGKWYDYPLTSTYNIDAKSSSNGSITIENRVYEYKLAGNTLTLSIANNKFVFIRTTGIKSEGLSPY